MSHQTNLQIARYLTTGFYEDTGRPASSFPISSTGMLTVFEKLASPAVARLADYALSAWTSVSGIGFRQNGTNQNHDIKLQDSASGAWSQTWYLGNGDSTASVVNVSQDWSATYGTQLISYATQTWIHEIGHALGLGHSGPYNGSASIADAVLQQDSWQRTVMSYFAPWENPSVNADASYVLTPMPADIVAVHALYGTPSGVRTGADVYGYDGTASGAYAAITTLLDNSASVRPFFFTIFDQGGRDTINMSQDGRSQTVNLRPDTFSSVLGGTNNMGIAHETLIEDYVAGSGADRVGGNWLANNIRGLGGNDRLDGRWGNDVLRGDLGNDTLSGGRGNDSLWGNQNNDRLFGGGGNDNLNGGIGSDRLEGHHGADRLFGADGRDTLIGGHGRDNLFGGAGDDRLIGGSYSDGLWGGAGADQFVFGWAANSDTNRDRVWDFQAGVDHIDLRGMGLNFIGRRGFDGSDAVLRKWTDDYGTHLTADRDGDRDADFHLVLRGISDVVADDLWL